MEDLAPCAKAAGFRTAYINFWEQKSDPVHCIAKGVERSLAKQTNPLHKPWKKEVNIKMPGLAFKAEGQKQSESVLAHDSLELLLKPKGNVLVMFDEVQHLATDSQFEELIATLRTFLDSHKDRVRAVFTGSSQSRLNRIFKHHKAAFYRGASLVEFPDMDERFVCHLSAVFKDITGNALDETRAVALFEQFNHSPFLLVDLLQTMMREGMTDFTQGLAYYRRVNDPDQQWLALWQALKPIDQLVLCQVLIPGRGLYQEETFQLLGDMLGIDAVSRGMVQSSLNRLKEQGIVNCPARGVWELESTEFKQFIVDEM